MTALNDIKGLLFDKDGTLIDYAETWMPVNWKAASLAADGDEASIARMMAAGGYSAEEGRILAGAPLAQGNTHEIASCFAGVNPSLDQEVFVPLLDRLFVEEGQSSAVAVPALRETVTALSESGYRLGIATSDSEAGIHATLAGFEVLQHFDFLAGYDSGHGVKPEPGMMLAFCAATGLTAESVAMIGDNSHDMELGRNAGAGLCIGVCTGTSLRAELEPLADLVLESIAELPALLNSHAKG